MSIDLVLLIMNLAYVVLFAVVTEGLVEWFGVSVPAHIKPHVAALLAIVLCAVFGVDLTQFAPPPYQLDSAVPFGGNIVTGLAVGRMSNYLNDRWQRWLVTDVPAAPIDSVIKEETAWQQ